MPQCDTTVASHAWLLLERLMLVMPDRQGQEGAFLAWRCTDCGREVWGTTLVEPQPGRLRPEAMAHGRHPTITRS